MADEFDHNTFDWGDDTPGINLDDLAPDVTEIAMAAALSAQEEAFGWRYLKRSEVKEGSGRLFRCNYHMPVESRKWFEEQFPGYTFVWDGATEHHDHPVAHLCTELNEMSMVERLVRSGETWIDLFGNGHRDRKYKRKCINLFAMRTPKDYLRYQHLGPNDLEFNMDKLCDPKGVLGKIDNVTCTHAAYYLSMDDIGRIVNTSEKRRFHALIHRHSDTVGFLNHGEQKYTVSDDGSVEQVNVSTGERYTHPSLEALFHQGSAKTPFGGVAWTVRAGGGDSFILEFVGCPNVICEKFVPLRLLKPESREVITYQGLTVKKFLHWTWMSAKLSQGHSEIVIEDKDLFSSLRTYVAGKERTPRLKSETMAHARRLCNKYDIISMHGGRVHDIRDTTMHQYVEAAFYVDVRSELETVLAMHKENVVMTKALNKYYAEGALPRDFTRLTGAACVTKRAVCGTVVSVATSLSTLGVEGCRAFNEALLPDSPEALGPLNKKTGRRGAAQIFMCTRW